MKMEKQYFIASIVREGILGGWIEADEEQMTFRTNKLTVSPNIRNLPMLYRDINDFSRRSVFFFPVFSIVMNDGETHEFVIFRPGRFSGLLEEKVKR